MENEINDLKYELASLSYLKEELRLKDRQVLEYTFSDSKQIDLIVVFGDNYLQRSDFRYLGSKAWVESSVITMISLFLTEEERRRSGVWDSLADEKSPVRQSYKIKEILRNLDLAMANQIKKRPSTFSFASFCINHAQNVPRQPNFFDCGVVDLIKDLLT
ncbi:hypothetical protein G4B88_026468 [Cannabis sativa]|uniref:Ubiquitin-like protease family profile domain-containing protein n=1 Tax=Cannabis sativa TaxID=3483 RepID=A0A7J6GZ31_CANSA|nr:hypothetical protein G4B88_026468 [Cannabis sativa]